MILSACVDVICSVMFRRDILVRRVVWSVQIALAILCRWRHPLVHLLGVVARPRRDYSILARYSPLGDVPIVDCIVASDQVRDPHGHFDARTATLVASYGDVLGHARRCRQFARQVVDFDYINSVGDDAICSVSAYHWHLSSCNWGKNGLN